ncbi:thioredoxin family protein [Kineosporia sp. R_H_3]|uniref:thioredoxin family protein n=1 Tax=Kineosporia sp. R_H_3 TaxID=1961848 RepID=UPI000B4AC81E|nr:thioredoxin family protein [Kineosporia sp. R_H_3]
MTPWRTSWTAACGIALLALTACGGADAAAPAPAAVTTPASQPAAQSSQPAAADPAGAGSYVDYATYRKDPTAYADGRVVLFFHASWCPNCRLTEKNLTEDPASIPADLTVVKVDFDTETDLRAKYGITQQHTFVAVGPDGAERAKWTGTHSAAEISKRAV